jgi:hypothetical protein
MSQDLRRDLISRNLGIIPINHGQVYTFQIALPESERVEFSLEHHQAIESSLLQHKTNLVSLIIRRTDQYDDEDIEYEIVYGTDWLQVAQALNIEKLWAWVFDMDDEQAQQAKADMAQLLGSSALKQQVQPQSPSAEVPKVSDSEIEVLLDRKLQIISDSLKQVLTSSLDTIKSDIEERLRTVHYRLDNVGGSLSELPKLIEHIENLSQGLEKLSSKSKSFIEYEGEPVNLTQAQASEVEAALKQIRTQPKQIKAALKAINFWQQSPQGLSWLNLEESAKAKTGSKNKISGFAQGTYDRLKTIGEIPE